MKRKYRVLLIGSSSPHIANHLSRIEGCEFTVAVVSNSNKFLNKNQTFYRVNFSLKNPLNWINSPKKIDEIIREFNPDVIHVHQANSIGLYSVLGNKKNQTPIALTVWGSDILINPKKNFIYREILKYILRNVDIITSDSIYMADIIRDLYCSKNKEIEICNFGVKEYDVIINKKKIIYSNRMHNPLYRIEEILKAFARFKKCDNTEDWILKIAGIGSETENLKKLANDLKIENSLEFVGFVDSKENSKLYAESTFFISIPKSDATSMSLLESMYYQCIPILSDLPANREWVKSGWNGLIVEDLSSNFILEAMKFYNDKIGMINRNIVMEKATINKSEENFRNVLLKIIKN